MVRLHLLWWVGGCHTVPKVLQVCALMSVDATLTSSHMRMSQPGSNRRQGAVCTLGPFPPLICKTITILLPTTQGRYENEFRCYKMPQKPPTMCYIRPNINIQQLPLKPQLSKLAQLPVLPSKPMGSVSSLFAK